MVTLPVDNAHPLVAVIRGIVFQMESPQMYDNSPQSIVQIELKKVTGGVSSSATMAANSTSNSGQSQNNTNNNNNSAAINLNNNSVGNNNNMQIHMQQQQQQQCVQNNNNQNILLQKQMQQYSQSDLEELTSQEISLDLQHLIDDQFRDPESIGIFTEMVTASANGAGVTGSLQSISKVLQLQQQQQSQQQTQQNRQSNGNLNNNNNNGYNRSTLAYMPQPVHTGATYTNNSSDENSSVGSDLTTTSIKEEPVDPIEYRRQLAAANGIPFPTNNGTLTTGNGGHNGNIYQTPPNYASNGSGNTFTTLTSGNLHHSAANANGNAMNGNGLGQILPHLPSQAAHLVSLKHKQHQNQMMGHGSSHRKHGNKHADKGTDEYRRRRERNNIAVRKSREKAKVRSREVEEKVKALIKEKDALIRRLEEMTNEMQLHKQLYMHLMNHSNPEIIQICRSMLNLVNMNDHVM